MTARRVFFAALLTAGLGAAASAQPMPPYPHGWQAPPAPPYETVPPPPGHAYIWAPGHWHWNGYKYRWIRGHYVLRHPGWHHWANGHWAVIGGRWAWIPGHWN